MMLDPHAVKIKEKGPCLSVAVSHTKCTKLKKALDMTCPNHYPFIEKGCFSVNINNININFQGAKHY